MFESGTSIMAKFNPVFHSYYIPPLHSIIKMMKTVSKEWPKNETISLSHYEDRSTIEPFELWDKTINRILLVPSEVDEIFKNCERMKPIWAKRK